MSDMTSRSDREQMAAHRIQNEVQPSGHFADFAPERYDPALRSATPEALLDAMIQLTHRIHASDTARVAELDRTADLRAQRDLVRAEALRRMGA